MWGMAHGMDMVPLVCVWGREAHRMASEGFCCGKLGVILEIPEQCLQRYSQYES